MPQGNKRQTQTRRIVHSPGSHQSATDTHLCIHDFAHRQQHARKISIPQAYVLSILHLFGQQQALFVQSLGFLQVSRRDGQFSKIVKNYGHQRNITGAFRETE